MFILIPLNQHPNHFHERRERMRFIFTNLINKLVKHPNKFVVILFGVRDDNLI